MRALDEGPELRPPRSRSPRRSRGSTRGRAGSGVRAREPGPLWRDVAEESGRPLRAGSSRAVPPRRKDGVGHEGSRFPLQSFETNRRLRRGRGPLAPLLGWSRPLPGSRAARGHLRTPIPVGRSLVPHGPARSHRAVPEPLLSNGASSVPRFHLRVCVVGLLAGCAAREGSSPALRGSFPQGHPPARFPRRRPSAAAPGALESCATAESACRLRPPTLGALGPCGREKPLMPDSVFSKLRLRGSSV